VEDEGPALEDLEVALRRRCRDERLLEIFSVGLRSATTARWQRTRPPHAAP
jgi:hypothetical protein